MESLAQLVENRTDSALSHVLKDAPRLVDTVVDAARTETPILSLSSLFGAKTDESKTPTGPKSSIEADDDDEAYIPLTAEEIKVKAESKAEMWGAIIALFFGFIHRYAAYQKIREGDKALVKEYDQFAKSTGTVPTYEQTHPYFAARERWDDFEEALKEADDEAELKPAQLTMLRKAIEADLRAKNKRGTLKTGSIAETLFEIMIIKAMAPLMQVSMMTVNKMVDKTMR